MPGEEVNLEIIGLSSKAPGGFRADLDIFNTFFPKFGINPQFFGYTKGNPKGTGKYIPILTRFFPNLYLIFLALFFRVPFLPIRKKSVIMTNRSPDLLPFIIFYPKHEKIFRMTSQTEILKINNSKFVFHIYNLLERVCLPFIDKFIVLDKSSKDYLKRKYNVPEAKIVTIPVMVDLNVFKPIEKREARERKGFEHKKEIILYVGRLTKAKNIELLLSSFREVKKDRQNVMLILAGTGPYEGELKQFVSKYNIEGARFLGHIDHDEMPILMNCADIFAFPSLSEGSPNVIKEALACGLPVISTAVGDITEYVRNGENGYIVESELRSFTNGILNTLENKEALGHNAIKRREELGIESAMKKYSEVFYSLWRPTT